MTNFKKTTCIFLSLLFVLQLLPIQYLGLKTIEAYAAETTELPSGYKFEVPKESDNTVTAVIPETISREEIQLSSEEYIKYESDNDLDDDKKFFQKIISEKIYFSELSNDEKNFVCSYISFTENELEELESKGYSIISSADISDLISKTGHSYTEILDLKLSPKTIRNVLTQLYIYLNNAENDVLGTNADAKVREYIVQGYSAEEAVIQQSKNDSSDDTFDSTFLNELTAFSSSGGGTEDVYSPYYYNYDENERVSLNTGELIYETTDYTIPGKNGLDLSIGRRYRSHDSKRYEQLVWSGSSEYYSPGQILSPQNNHNISLYKLGEGWEFSFTSIESIMGDLYVHLSDGRIYRFEPIEGSRSNLVGYEYADVYAGWCDEDFSIEGITTSPAYYIEYYDGKTEYFSSTGKILCIEDRFGNRILFYHSTNSGYPYITITDSLNQQIIISGESTETGHKIEVLLPNNLTLTYNVITASNGMTAISSFMDASGNETHYSYALYEKLAFETNSRKDDNDYLVLSTITHPTNAQTIFEYEIKEDNRGSLRVREIPYITIRKDVVGTEELNKLEYEYLNHDSRYNYHTAVTNSYGTTTKSTFGSNDNLLSTSILVNNSTIQETTYSYNIYNNRPTGETLKYYSADGNSCLESKLIYEYNDDRQIKNIWSSYADGDKDNTDYLTSYTYVQRYALPQNKTYKTNGNTTVTIKSHSLSPYKVIHKSETYVALNGIESLINTTEYTYDAYGNILTEKRWNADKTAHELIEYTYQNGAYLTQEKHSSVKTADGASAVGTSGTVDGIITYNYTYDNLGRMTSSKDGKGNTTTYTYDNLGNVTSITNPDNTTVTYTRNYTNNYVIVKDENNNQIKYTYTPLGLEYETIDVATGNVITRKEYDNSSRLIKAYEYVYGSVTEYAYDYLDRVTSETVKQGNTVLSQTLYSYEYAVENGTYNKVTKTVVGETDDMTMVSTEYTDKHGNVAKTGKAINGVEYFDTYTYDYVGNNTSILSAADSAKNLAHTSKYEYNHDNQVTKTYNANNQYTTNTYDAYGRMVSATDYAGTPTTYTYDTLGRLTSQTITIETGKTFTTKYEYDAAGNIIREWNQNNAVGSTADWAKTEYTYDNRNRLTSVKQYNDSTVASTTSYTYDGVGNVLTMTAGGKTTTYTYDRFGNVLTEKDALNRTESYSYSNLGKLQSKTDRNGVTTNYTYDNLGRLIYVSAGSGNSAETITYSYTKTGRILSEENGNNRTTYSYDALGRTSSVTETEFPSLSAYTKTFTYDLADNRTGFTLAKSGQTVHNITYTYDNLNRLSTVKENGTVEATYTYDTNGNRASLTLGNGVVTTYSYNLANWVTALTNKNSGGATLSSYAYTYYASGNQKSKTDNTGKVTSYVYDDIGRLTSESETNGVTLSYTYDAAGNRTKLTATGSENYVTNYTYNNANRLTSEVKTVGSTAQTTSYTYDNNGNMLSKTSPDGTQANTYNKLNQLVSSINAGVTSTYTYNADGIRTSKTVGTTTTNYLLDGGNVVGEVQDGTVTATYLRGANLLSTTSGTSTSYYLFNAHGDVTGLTNGAQTVTKSYEYDAFGNEDNPSASDTNPFRYCGEYFDKETGTYYLRARYYDPSIGRFTQQDTHWNTANMIYGDNPQKINQSQDALGLGYYSYSPNLAAIMQAGNLYVYCGNNPIRFIDKDGEFWETAFDVVSLIASFIDALNNPDDGLAWAGVVGDVVDLCPFVMGVGEVIKAKRVADVLDGAGDAINITSKIGRKYGKLGTVIVNDGKQYIDWSKITDHGLKRMNERGATQEMIENWIKNGIALQQSTDKVLYVTKEGVAVVTKQGVLVTAYTSDYFDDTMKQVIKELFEED